MPAPKMPIASPRRSGGNQALTNGTPTANDGAGDAEEEPAHEQQGVGVEGEERDEQHRHDRDGRDEREHDRGRRSGRSARRPRSGPASRPAPAPPPAAPRRTRSARPARPSRGTSGPSGLISAHAQKFTAKPIVASASISHGVPGCAGLGDASRPAVATWCCFMASPLEKEGLRHHGGGPGLAEAVDRAAYDGERVGHPASSTLEAVENSEAEDPPRPGRSDRGPASPGGRSRRRRWRFSRRCAGGRDR